MARIASVTMLVMETCAAPSSLAVPSVRLNDGVEMPRLALAPMGVGAEVSEILDTGLTHIFTALDYYDQENISAGLAGRERSSYFLTTMTPPCIHSASRPVRSVTDPEACYNLTRDEVLAQLELLGVDHADLVMLHGPSRPYGFQGPCGHPELNLAQWRAYADLQRQGKARAIGVSNYCQSCIDDILADASLPVPAVNQLQFHIGMGPDPEGIVSYLDSHGIALQTYSPLASGELVHNRETQAIAAAHNKSSAQVALRWIAMKGKNIPANIVTNASPKYLAQDADIFDWDLMDEEVARLDALSCDTNPELCTQHGGTPSWGCTMFQPEILA